MFTAALDITAKRWKQPKHLSVNEWISKTWSIHTMEHHSTLKRRETDTHGNMDEP